MRRSAQIFFFMMLPKWYDIRTPCEHTISRPYTILLCFFFIALYVRTILFIYKIQIKQEPAATRPQLHTHYAGEFLRGEALKKWVIRRNRLHLSEEVKSDQRLEKPRNTQRTISFRLNIFAWVGWWLIGQTTK